MASSALNVNSEKRSHVLILGRLKTEILGRLLVSRLSEWEQEQVINGLNQLYMKVLKQK